MSNNDTDTEENIVDLSKDPLSDDEPPKIGAQLATDCTMYYPTNTMRTTLNSENDVSDVDNVLMTTEKEVIERPKQDILTPVIYPTKTDNERKSPSPQTRTKELLI